MDYTKDYLLNKQITVFQPKDGYRASTDAVLLSAALNARKNDTILDVGSGTGAISLCIAERFKDYNVKIIGLEIQKELVELSNKSSIENGFDGFLTYICHDIKTPFKPRFNHIITNPPYSEGDMPSPNKNKAIAHNHQDFSLKEWITFCIKRLEPQGFFYIINRAEATTEILSTISGKLGNIKIIPLYSKKGQDAKRVIITAQLDSKAPAKITPGLIIHDENGKYTNDAEKILRDGQKLS